MKPRAANPQGLVGPRVFNYLSDAKIKTAKIQIESLSAAVDLFYLDVGHYPSASEGLDVLAPKPAGEENWNGPYLKTASLPADPWGRAYVYKTPGDHAPFEIGSYGPSGTTGDTSHLLTSAAR